MLKLRFFGFIAAVGVGCVLGSSAVVGQARDALLNRCDRVDGWKLNLGTEFPRATGKLGTEVEGGQTYLGLAE